jgi:hypothetical protein
MITGDDIKIKIYRRLERLLASSDMTYGTQVICMFPVGALDLVPHHQARCQDSHIIYRALNMLSSEPTPSMDTINTRTRLKIRHPRIENVDVENRENFHTDKNCDFESIFELLVKSATFPTCVFDCCLPLIKPCCVSAETTAPTGRSQAACVIETDFAHSFDCDDDEGTDACNLYGEVDRYQDDHGKTTCCGRERKQHPCRDGCPGYGGVPSDRFPVFASPRDQVLRYDLILSIVSHMSAFGEPCILPSSS